jgi:hypothetical protein
MARWTSVWQNWKRYSRLWRQKRISVLPTRKSQGSRPTSQGSRPTSRLKTDVAELKVVIVEIKADAKATAGELRASIAESKADVIKWLSGAVFAAVAILLSAMFFLAGQIARSNMQPQPIVIQLPPMPGAQSATASAPTPLQIK